MYIVGATYHALLLTLFRGVLQMKLIPMDEGVLVSIGGLKLGARYLHPSDANIPRAATEFR